MPKLAVCVGCRPFATVGDHLGVVLKQQEDDPPAATACFRHDSFLCFIELRPGATGEFKVLHYGLFV